MRLALTALTDELRRLQASGVKSVAVSEASLRALKEAVGKSRPPGGAPPPVNPPSAAVPSRVTAESSDAPGARAMAPKAFSLPEGTKAERWEALRRIVMADEVCRRQVRPGKKVVLGVGNLDARIMFVGEAPGAEEEIQGEPFVGPAGQLLTRMIQAMGLQRADVYIGNIMNWRPPLPVDAAGVQYGNRPPTADEMAYCLPYLKAQIDIIDPAFLVALGATAASGLLGAGSFRALGEVRGRWREFGRRPLMITYHPSYILRNPTNRSKRMIWEDLLKVMERSGLPISDKQRAFFLDK